MWTISNNQLRIWEKWIELLNCRTSINQIKQKNIQYRIFEIIIENGNGGFTASSIYTPFRTPWSFHLKTLRNVWGKLKRHLHSVPSNQYDLESAIAGGRKSVVALQLLSIPRFVSEKLNMPPLRGLCNVMRSGLNYCCDGLSNAAQTGSGGMQAFVTINSASSKRRFMLMPKLIIFLR